jgi:hypothetical protein
VVKKDMYPATILGGRLSTLHAMKVMMTVTIVIVNMRLKLRNKNIFVRRKVTE